MLNMLNPVCWNFARIYNIIYVFRPIFCVLFKNHITCWWKLHFHNVLHASTTLELFQKYPPSLPTHFFEQNTVWDDIHISYTYTYTPIYTPLYCPWNTGEFRPLRKFWLFPMDSSNFDEVNFSRNPGCRSFFCGSEKICVSPARWRSNAVRGAPRPPTLLDNGPVPRPAQRKIFLTYNSKYWKSLYP